MPYDTPVGPLATDQPPKRGIFDSILDTLYPGGEYSSMVSPDALRSEQRLALRKTGLSLLASGGPQPAGSRNIGADIARALDPTDWQTHIAQVAEHAAQLGALQKKAALEATAQQIMGQFPVPTDHRETDQERDTRLLNLTNAYQQAGLMDHAKAVGELRSSLRAPALVEHGGVLYNQYGDPVKTLPAGLQTIAGSQLYATAIQRLQPWSDIQRTVSNLNTYRDAPIVAGRLDAPSSAGLIAAAQSLMQSHNMLAKQEVNPIRALEHVEGVGLLARILEGLGGAQTLTAAQRDEILKAVDPLIDSLNTEQERVKNDIHTILRNRFKDQPGQAEEIWDLIPNYPSFGRGGAARSNRLNQMDRDLGRNR